MDQIIKMRQELHRQPELSNEEKNTARLVKGFLEDFSPDKVITGIGGHGLAAVFEGGEEGSTTMFRAELDALPIPDNSEKPYASENDRVSHACGHDGHMAVLLGLAKQLKETPPSNGRVILLFQPAEETGEGAMRVLEDKKFRNLEPDRVFALHNLPNFPLHTVLLKEDVFACASVGMEIRLRGEFSHAAFPEQGNNPAAAMGQILNRLLQIPVTDMDMFHYAKITPIHMNLGERAFGTSPGEGVMMFTLRAGREQVLEKMMKTAEKYARDIAAIQKLKTKVLWHERFTHTENSPEEVELIRSIAKTSGLEIMMRDKPYAWSEDFGHFTARYPGVLFGLGSGEDHPHLHHSAYDFPDELIETGVGIFEQIVRKYHN